MNARLRYLRVIVVFALAAGVTPAAQAKDEEFIPGYTDFPNALRIEGFTAGHTDFPNHLRVESVYDRTQANSGVEERVVIVPAPAAGGFDWIDAGIGAGGAAGLMLLAAGGALAAVHRRPTRRTALTG